MSKVRFAFIYFIIQLTVLLGSSLNAQNFIALSGGNYQGIYSVYDNPSKMTSSKLYMDINLIGNSFSFNSNYAFFDGDKHRINTYFAKDYQWPTYHDSEGAGRKFDIYRNDDLKFGNLYNQILGPSYMIAYERHAFAFTTSYKTNLYFENMTQDIANFLYEAVDFDIQHNNLYLHHEPEKMKFGYLSWMEVGFSYAYTFYREGWDFLAVGVTLKPLFSNFGGYGRIDDLEYIVYNDTVMDVPNASFEYGIGGSLDRTKNLVPTPSFVSPLFNNFGFGGDIGLTYQRNAHIHRYPFHGRVCEWEFEPYQYRFSASLSDLGYINFYRNSYQHIYTGTYAHWTKATDTLKIKTLSDIDRKIQSYFDPNNEQSHERKFKMYLPSSLNLEADLPINYKNFIHAKVVIPFNLGEDYLMRSSIISVNWRYETPWFSIGVPLSIYDYVWQQPKVGFAIRVGNFMVGSDRLSNLIGLNDITGIDFYFGFRVSMSRTFRTLFIKGLCNPYKDRNIETFDYRQYRNR